MPPPLYSVFPLPCPLVTCLKANLASLKAWQLRNEGRAAQYHYQKPQESSFITRNLRESSFFRNTEQYSFFSNTEQYSSSINGGSGRRPLTGSASNWQIRPRGRNPAPWPPGSKAVVESTLTEWVSGIVLVFHTSRNSSRETPYFSFRALLSSSWSVQNLIATWRENKHVRGNMW